VPIYGDGSALRDFTYVDDLVDGLVRAIDRDLGYALLNLAGGRTVSVLEMVSALERELGVEAEIAWQPEQTGDVRRTWGDISAARTALGYEPKVGFDEGVRRTAEWLRDASRVQ
jgi:UDP-glucuronate 4-epimerase